MPRLKRTQKAPRCRCGVVPHRCWCPRAPFYWRAYDEVVAATYETLVHTPRGLRRRDRANG
jgi:hypothetical protein